MDFEPSAEQQMLIDQVRRFVREEIIPLEAKLDPDASELDPADHARLVEKTKGMGLFGIDIPHLQAYALVGKVRYSVEAFSDGHGGKQKT